LQSLKPKIIALFLPHLVLSGSYCLMVRQCWITEGNREHARHVVKSDKRLLRVCVSVLSASLRVCVCVCVCFCMCVCVYFCVCVYVYVSVA